MTIMAETPADQASTDQSTTVVMVDLADSNKLNLLRSGIPTVDLGDPEQENHVRPGIPVSNLGDPKDQTLFGDRKEENLVLPAIPAVGLGDSNKQNLLSSAIPAVHLGEPEQQNLVVQAIPPVDLGEMKDQNHPAIPEVDDGDPEDQNLVLPTVPMVDLGDPEDQNLVLPATPVVNLLDPDEQNLVVPAIPSVDVGDPEQKNIIIPATLAVDTAEKSLFRDIPVVDLGDPDEQNLVRAVAAASRDWGFFQAVNHGVPVEVIRNLQAAGAEFFRLPQAEKEAYAKPSAASIEGYGTSLNKSWGEHLFHKIWPPAAIDYRFWPKSPDRYRRATEEYGRHVREAVVERLFKCLSIGLGLEGHVLKESIGGDEIIHMMKINYYPPSPKEADHRQLGVQAHTDMCSLTILVPNEVPGLELLQDDRWIQVDYIPNALIVHIGDQIQRASNGYYKSVMHRSVVDKEKTRMSWPLFLEPPPELAVGPIPQLLVNRKASPNYQTMTFRDYAQAKLNMPKLIN